MIKRIIFRTVAFVIIVAGFKFAIDTKRPGSNHTVEQEYHQKMAELSRRYEAIEKEGVAANTTAESRPPGTPGTAQELLAALNKVHQEKERYIADLNALNVPKKFEEAHTTFLAWKKQEQETERKLIDGYAAYNSGKKELASKIDEMLKSSEKVSQQYEEKLSSIAKKSGFDSIEKFFGQKAKSEPAAKP